MLTTLIKKFTTLLREISEIMLKAKALLTAIPTDWISRYFAEYSYKLDIAPSG